MSDYIKREDAENVILGRCDESALWKLRRLPSADVVEVVRCKDCEYYRDSFGETYCDMTRGHVKVNDYCSYEEKEENE